MMSHPDLTIGSSLERDRGLKGRTHRGHYPSRFIPKIQNKQFKRRGKVSYLLENSRWLGLPKLVRFVSKRCLPGLLDVRSCVGPRKRRRQCYSQNEKGIRIL